jgi:hypothetical protein
MGSYIELNDTLRITKEQGFPKVLELEKHLEHPYALSDLNEEIFEFKDKPNIRIYQIPPVRCFLVEDIAGKWVYWGLCHMLEVKHDYINKTTSGKFKIIYLNNPEEMKSAFNLIDQNPETSYF